MFAYIDCVEACRFETFEGGMPVELFLKNYGVGRGVF
jgi:hypothetical protein